MRVTQLGTGDAVGVPAPLCDCEYCLASDPRRRSAVLLEAGGSTLLLDAPPDVTAGLHEAGVTDLDAVVLTHAHYDHFSGLNELNHAAYDRHVRNEAAYDHPTFGKKVRVVATPWVCQYVTHQHGHLTNRLDFEPLPEAGLDVGPFSVSAFPVEHGGVAFPTVGLVVRGPADGGGDVVVGYAPDVNDLPADLPPLPRFDLLFYEGSVLGPALHALPSEARETLARLPADRVALTNVSEHMAECHTEELRARTDHEVWRDGDATVL